MSPVSNVNYVSGRTEVWMIFCEELAKTIEKHNLLVHSFVLMSNHFHLIASTPKANIDRCMHQFMTKSSRRLTLRGNRINETFAGRHFKCILQHSNYYLNAYKYNYRNPVTAKICEYVEDYPYSTLQMVIKKQKTIFQLAEDTTYMSDPVGTLKWLNTEPTSQNLEAVRYGLKRQYFISKKYRNTNKYILTQDDLI